jgi:hypothetical protein
MHSTCKPQAGSERLQMSDTPGILESPKSPMCTSRTRSSAVQRASATGCAARQKTGAFGRGRQAHATAAETRGGRWDASWLAVGEEWTRAQESAQRTR